MDKLIFFISAFAIVIGSVAVSPAGALAQTTGPAVTVLSPNGGDRWVIGQWASIAWRRNWMPSGANGLVDITVRRESVPFSQAIAGGAADSAGFSFVVPSWLVPANDYRIIIGSWGIGGSVTAPLSDESDQPFSIATGAAPVIISISSFQANQGQTVDVVLTGRNFTGANTFSASGVSPVSDRGFQLVSTQEVSDTQINLRISVASDAAPGLRSITVTTPSGASNAVTFTVTAASASPTIALLSPTRNEYVNRGGPYMVRWSTSGTLPSDASVLLYLLRDSVPLGRISSSAVSAILNNNYVWDTSIYFLEGSGAARKPEAGGYQIRAVLQSGGIPVTTALGEQFLLSDEAGSSRDGRRVGDIRQLQLALELYYDIFNSYPVGLSQLAPRFIATVLRDPLEGADYAYRAVPSGCIGSQDAKCANYHLGASLEFATNSVFASDADQDTTFAGGFSGGDSRSCNGAQAGRACYDVTNGDLIFPAIGQVIPDGSLIRARGYAEVWIIKGGYRRHIISPRVFTFYKHLGFAQVIDVEVGTVNQYTESRLIRAVGDGRVYELTPNSQKRWLNMYANQFLEIGHSPAEIYDVNAAERNFYATGPDFTPADFGIGR